VFSEGVEQLGHRLRCSQIRCFVNARRDHRRRSDFRPVRGAKAGGVL
jgi:hypothetical protein